MSSFGFSYKKATQALNFLARKNGGTIDKLKALKLVYFADKFHLRKFGRTISNDEYYAMNFGPVASGTKDILELSSFLDKPEKEYAIRYIRPINNSDYVESIQNTAEDELSKSDIEALDYVWEKLGSIDSLQLCELTHKYPEWKKFEEHLKSGITTRMKMELADFFIDPNENIEKFYPLSNEEKKFKLQYLKEQEYLESFWN